MKPTGKFALPFSVFLAIFISCKSVSDSVWDISKADYSGKTREKTIASLPKAPKGIKQPNIVIILADDLGKFDISAYKGKVNTPNIDAIGKSGVIFDQGYASAPICSPSRAALLTGRYQQRFGHEFQPMNRYPQNTFELYMFKHVIKTDNWEVRDSKSFPRKQDIPNQGLPPSEITLADLLRQNGYATGMVGKWHLGNHAPFIPIHRGFDSHYGFYEAFSLFSPKNDKNIVHVKPDEFSYKHIWKEGRKGSCEIRRNDTIIQEDEYLTFRFAEEACQFIDQNKSKPFFLYVPFSAPHTPFQVPKTYYDQFPEIKDHKQRVYFAMIKALDDAVGMITAKIREAGLDENTLIWFSSDNGAATYTGACDNLPLNGGKLSFFEGGINVPLMLQWKNTVKAGQVYSNPVMLFDIFSTCAEAAHAKKPEDRIYDGIDLIPFIQDKTIIPHPILYWRSGFNAAVRKGDYKIYIDFKAKTAELFNLKNDIGEKSPLNGSSEDEKTASEMKLELENWGKQMMKPLWPYLMEYKMLINGKIYRLAV